MTDEFDKKLMSIKDQLVVLRQQDEFKPDPSGSEKPSAIEEPTKSAEEKYQECVAAKQSGESMNLEEAQAACKGASGDAEEEAPKESSCVEKKMSEGMSKEEAESACAPKSDDSRWAKPFVGVLGHDKKYSQIVGPYVTRGISHDAKVEYDAKTGLWRPKE